ncbi:MAG: DNA repair protein RecO [Gammaproteobacteria bacterium]|nr:DNA repair protein RecO [Gammaproteobacteria bacterium]
MSRIEAEPGYILHRRAYRETSLILEILTAQHGRLGVVARGVQRRKGGAEVLQQFRPLVFTIGGRGELLTLAHCEPAGRTHLLAGERLYSGMYANELVMRFAHRADPNEDLYRSYMACLAALAGDAPLEAVLRRFELALLEACGYALQLTGTADTHEPIEPGRTYHYAVERGPLPQPPPTQRSVAVPGAVLLALGGETVLEADDLPHAKRLLRFVLRHYLGDKPLASRTLFEGGAAGGS